MYTIERQIEEFINEYKRSSVIAETTVRAVLKRAQEYGAKYEKYFYNFIEKVSDKMIILADDIMQITIIVN